MQQKHTKITKKLKFKKKKKIIMYNNVKIANEKIHEESLLG